MQCETIKYENGVAVTKPKRSYETLDGAISHAKEINSNSKIIHKVVAYKCKKCMKYHLGRNGKEVTDKERKKWDNNFKQIKFK